MDERTLIPAGRKRPARIEIAGTRPADHSERAPRTFAEEVVEVREIRIGPVRFSSWTRRRRVA